AAWFGEPLVPHFTRDHGKTWTACAGLTAGLRVIADPHDAARFYAYDADNGAVLVSTDGAAHFAVRATGLPKTPVATGGPRWRPPAGALFAAPDQPGELWLAARFAGLFRSTDGGASFTPVGGPAEAYSLGFGASAPGQTHSALYLAGKLGELKGLFRSDDCGATWLRINDDAHQFGSLGHVTGDPRIFGRVYFATGGRGVFYGDPQL
ncbi:MAG TPA: xyloglucanase, partial [Opitutaceae bacterium]|nr:xyloglucanase [Opitutaceae bacterium]